MEALLPLIIQLMVVPQALTSSANYSAPSALGQRVTLSQAC